MYLIHNYQRLSLRLRKVARGGRVAGVGIMLASQAAGCGFHIQQRPSAITVTPLHLQRIMPPPLRPPRSYITQPQRPSVSARVIRFAWATIPPRIRTTPFNWPSYWPVVVPIVVHHQFAIHWATNVAPGGALVQMYHHIGPTGRPHGQAFFWCAPVQFNPSHDCRLAPNNKRHQATLTVPWPSSHSPIYVVIWANWMGLTIKRVPHSHVVHRKPYVDRADWAFQIVPAANK